VVLSRGPGKPTVLCRQAAGFSPTGKVRVVQHDKETWWVLADVCKALGIGNASDVAKRLDDDEKMTIDSIEGHSGKRGGARKLTIINESGLYSVVLRSDKPQAKAFKRWVTHDVLPAIRKDGYYTIADRKRVKTSATLSLRPAWRRAFADGLEDGEVIYTRRPRVGCGFDTGSL
jgi:prophage antirepressor-like protein